MTSPTPGPDRALDPAPRPSAAPGTGAAKAAAEPDDGLLVRRASAGDTASFEALYRRHHRRVYALALRMTRRVPLAEELCQQAFVSAWQALEGFRGDSSFATWLHGIVVRTVLGHRRSEHRRGALYEAAGEEAGWAEAVARAMPEARIDLERAIAALPERARAVLVLHDVEGWRQRDIAHHMDVAVGTVKAQLHRARKLIKETLQ